MDGLKSVDQLLAEAQQSYPQKESSKEKTTDKRSSVNSTVDNSTVVKGSTTVKRPIEQLQDHQNRQKSIGQQQLADRERNSRLLLNAEIDDRLHNWVMEGITSEEFMPWVAKCCHVLGLQKVVQLSNAARNGKTPDRLFSSMLKGAMNLHYKQIFEQQQSREQ